MSLNNVYDAKAGGARQADRRAGEKAQGRRLEDDMPGHRAPVIGLTGGIGTGKSTAAEYLVYGRISVPDEMADEPFEESAGKPSDVTAGESSYEPADSRGESHSDSSANLPENDGLRFAHVDADAISRQITEKRPGERNPVLEEIGRAFDAARHPRVLRKDGSLDRKVMADIVFHDSAKKKLLEEIMFREIIAEIHRQIDAAKEEGRPVLLDVPLLFESGLDSLCDKVIVLTADEDVRVRRVTQRDGCSAEDVLARIRNQMPEEEKLARADFVVDNSGTPEDMIRQLDEILSGIVSPLHFSPETPA